MSETLSPEPTAPIEGQPLPQNAPSDEAAKIEAPPEPAAVDPVLVEKLASLRTLVMIDKLLANGQFPGGAAADVLGAMQFLQKLHAPILKECQSHPDFARATNSKPAAPPLSPEEIEARAEAKLKAEAAVKEKADLKRKRKAAKAKRLRSN